jgi:hypothetical protein
VTFISRFFLFSGATAPQWAKASSFKRCLDHTQRRATVGRTSLEEWSSRRSGLYLTTNNTHNRDIHAPDGIRTYYLNSRTASDLRLRPCGHWVWLYFTHIGTSNKIIIGAERSACYSASCNTRMQNWIVYL